MTMEEEAIRDGRCCLKANFFWGYDMLHLRQLNACISSSSSSNNSNSNNNIPIHACAVSWIGW